MIRVWSLALSLIVIMAIVYFTVGFFGEDSLKFGAVLVVAGAAAAYLPGGVALSRAIYLIVGVLVGALGFGAGALMLPDNDFGVFLGGCIPVLISAVIAMWSRKQEVLLTLLLGVGALTAVYTTAFFTDPQGINYSLPIAIGSALAPLGLGYLLAAIIKTFFPSTGGKAAAADPAVEGDAPSDAPEGETSDSTDADSTEENDQKTDQLIPLS